MLRPCGKQVRLTGRKEHLAVGGVTLACASQIEEESKQAKDVFFHQPQTEADFKVLWQNFGP